MKKLYNNYLVSSLSHFWLMPFSPTPDFTNDITMMNDITSLINSHTNCFTHSSLYIYIYILRKMCKISYQRIFSVKRYLLLHCAKKSAKCINKKIGNVKAVIYIKLMQRKVQNDNPPKGYNIRISDWKDGMHVRSCHGACRRHTTDRHYPSFIYFTNINVPLQFI